MEQEFRDRVNILYEGQPMFKQAVTEFLESILPHLSAMGASKETYDRLARLLVPERAISFKVVWENDRGELEHNVGYRIQFSSALGPYKGGLRFDPSVNEDVLKFLGFEQIFKNALTGLPLGGGKGGSDFDPKGKSDAEIWRFCVSFMTELSRYIGPDIDVPAGDIGVGSREVNYLYGAYKKMVGRADGALTGKGVVLGGSEIRTEATGYGAVYFMEEMLSRAGKKMEGMKIAISGSGNVALHVAEKCIHIGASVLTLSDRGGYLYAKDGFTSEFIVSVKAEKGRGSNLRDVEIPSTVVYKEGKFWRDIVADIYIPSATQNEIDEDDAKAIVSRNAVLVAEAANMPTTLLALAVFQSAPILFAPSKAVNAGGVAVSGLEMAQNASHSLWARDEVDEKLRKIMKHIHTMCVRFGEKENGSIDYVKGANIGGFERVFKAMEALRW